MNEKNIGESAAGAARPTVPTTVPQFCAQDRTELVVYVRQVLGFMPKNSLVLITVAGQRLTSVLRVNLLPNGATSVELEEYLQHLVASCPPLRDASQLLALVFSDHVWPRDATCPSPADIAQLAQRFLPISHAYYVDPASIHTIFPDTEEPAPLSQRIMDSTELSATLAVEGFTSVDSAQEQVARLVVAPWSGQHQLRSRAATISARKHKRELHQEFDARHAASLFARLEQWDHWIQRVARTGFRGRQDKNAAMIRRYPDDALELVTDLEHVRIRDLAIVLACFPLMYTVAGAFQHFFSEQVQNEFFQSLPSEHTSAPVPDEAFKVNFLANALMASTELEPDFARTTAFNALLRELLPLAARDSRQAILGLLAWSEWSMGRSSIAMVYLEKASAEDPSYRFTLLFSALLNTGKVAEWATRQR